MNAEMTTFDLEAYIEARDFASLREEIRNWPAGDLAELMEPLSAEKEAVVFRLLPRGQAAQIFSYLSSERQQELLKAMAHEDVVNMLNAMSDDDRTEFLEELPAEITQRLLSLFDAGFQRFGGLFQVIARCRVRWGNQRQDKQDLVKEFHFSLLLSFRLLKVLTWSQRNGCSKR